MVKRKYLYIGIPLSVLSGIFLVIDVFHQELQDPAVLVLMILAVVGLGLCYKARLFKQ